jgi:Flp pilus assembly protein TadD
MDLAWKRLDAEPSAIELDDATPVAESVAAPPLSETPRPWTLWLGVNETGDGDGDAVALADRAARRFLRAQVRARGLAVLSPPAEVPLPIAVHRLPRPGVRGERILFLPRLHEAFFDIAAGSFCAASPLYLLPELSRIASEAEPLTVVATAAAHELEARGRDVLAQRGLASRFEIRRVSSGSRDVGSSPPLPPRPTPCPHPFDNVPGWPGHLARGLASRDPEIRRAHFEDALRDAPENALCFLFLASSLIERKMFPEALATLRHAVELDPTLSAAHYEMGKALARTDDLDGAVASFRRTVELLPDYASAWGNLGAALGEKQDLEGAAEALCRAIALDPGSHALHSNLGVTYRDRGQLDEAERAFEKSLAIEPGFVFGHYNLAHTLYLGGRYPESIAAFERAQSLDPSRSPRQALLLAITRLASGDREGALREYRSVFERLTGSMKTDLRLVAEWDLEQLSHRHGTTMTVANVENVERIAELLRSLA